MKILMVNKFLYPNGGSETYMFKLGDYLKSLGHQVQYFGMEHENRCVNNHAEQYTSAMDFHNAKAIDKIKYSFKTIYSSEARKKIKIVLEDFKPDIVHLNNINFQLTPSIIYEIKKHNIPIVQTVHDVQIACPNHRMYIEHKEEICSKCLGGDYSNCLKEKCVQGSTMKSAIAMLESKYYHKKDTYSLVDRYICPSSFMAKTIEKGGVNKNRIHVLCNFSEKPTIDLEKNASSKYAVYFGRLSIEKGIKTLVEVCKSLPDIKFVFVGNGPLREQCEGIDNVFCAGFKSGDELSEIIKNAAFSIAPSECHENCPMSIIESKALGTPVIGSNLGGIPELIDEGKTGLIFEAGNQQQLAEKLTYLYNNDELLAQMSKNCIESNTNTIDVYTDDLMKIYNELLTEQKNG
ncbi:MAG: glycosyltransferase family 4 protein [Clostridium sp.]|nr:glycosyltransferase family 4 protein [Clostridium sp.]